MSKRVEEKKTESTQVTAFEGMNLPEVKRDYQKSCRCIAQSMASVEKNIIKIAVELTRVHQNEWYALDGYKNIYDFAKDRYNISRGTCSNYLGLCSVFGLDSKFTSTQMFILLPYARKGGDISEFSPDMSTRELKEAVREKTRELKEIPVADDAPVKDIKPESFVFCVTDELMHAPADTVNAFYSDIRTTVLNAFKKYGAHSVKIVIEK